MRPWLPLLCLLLAVPAAHAEVVLGPELPIAQPAVRPAPGEQSKPAVATNGRDFFATWADTRFIDADVFGARVDADGRLLDPTGIPLLPTQNKDHVADLVWNGSSYLVVEGCEFIGINAVDVLPDGRILGGLHLHSSWVFEVAIAWSGTHYLVTWSDPDGVHAQVFDSNLHRAGAQLDLGRGHRPDVASNGSGFLVALNNGDASRFVIVSTSGVASAPVAITDRQTDRIAVASDGVGYLLIHNGSENGEALSISDRGEIRRRVDLGHVSHPALAWDGLRYVAAWTEFLHPSRILGATFDAAGMLTRGPVRLLAAETPQTEPAIAAHRDSVLLTWVEEGEVRSRAFWPERFAEELMTASAVVSTGVPHQTPLDAVWIGSTLHVVWREGGILVLGTPGGASIDLGPGEKAALAANGSTIAVASTTDRLLPRAQVRVAGAPVVELDAPFVSSIDIAGDGEGFAVLWTGTTAAATREAMLARVGANGAITHAPRAITLPGSAFEHSAAEIVWTGSEYAALIARHHQHRVGRTIAYVDSEYFLHRFDRDLNPIGEPVAVRYSRYLMEAALATSGSDLFVAILGYDDAGLALTTQRLRLDGTPLEEPRLLARDIAMRGPRAAWTGGRYLVTTHAETGGVSIWEGTDRTIIAAVRPQAAFIAASPTGRAALLYSRQLQLLPDLPAATVERAMLRFFADPKLRAVRK